MLFKRAIAIVVLAVVAGCANNPLVGELTPIDGQDYYQVTKNLMYEEKRGMFGYVWEEGLLPCRYTARMVNAEGTFYEGDDTCIWQTMNRAVMGGSPFRGGVFIPKAPESPKRLYYYFDYNPEQATRVGGVITLLILQSSKGNIEFLPPITDQVFLQELQSAYVPAPASGSPSVAR